MNRHVNQPRTPSQASQRTVAPLPPSSHVPPAAARRSPPNAAAAGARREAGCLLIVSRLTSYDVRYLSIEREPKSRSIMNSGRPMTRWYGVPGPIPRRKRPGVVEVLSNAIRFVFSRGFTRSLESTADAGAPYDDAAVRRS